MCKELFHLSCNLCRLVVSKPNTFTSAYYLVSTASSRIATCLTQQPIMTPRPDNTFSPTTPVRSVVSCPQLAPLTMHYNCCFRRTKRKKGCSPQQIHLKRQPRLVQTTCDASRQMLKKSACIPCHLVLLHSSQKLRTANKPRVSEEKQTSLIEIGRVREAAELFLHCLRENRLHRRKNRRYASELCVEVAGVRSAGNCRYERRCHTLVVDVVPVDVPKEGVGHDLLCVRRT